MFQILKIKTYLKFHFHLSSPIKLYLNIIITLHKNKKKIIYSVDQNWNKVILQPIKLERNGKFRKFNKVLSVVSM